VKICGLTTTEAVLAAASAGARWLGFVFFPPSPRSLRLDAATDLVSRVPAGVFKVGLVVDAGDDLLEPLVDRVRLDVLQLHGSEPPERVAAIRTRFKLPVIKAMPIGDRRDLDRTDAYESVTDWFLFDARPAPGATRPGGNAVVFDWTLLGTRRWAKPWILAGGLHAGNVGQALAASGASAVDVSSGVEDAPGIKSTEKIQAFVAAVRAAQIPASGQVTAADE
jgi:phosphoribosylanthranilate isomerase